MNNWTEIKTIDDIPCDNWDRYEWEGKHSVPDEYTFKMMTVDGFLSFEPREALLKNNKPIEFVSKKGNVVMGDVRYREKQLPTDEYIEAHLWEIRHNTWVEYRACHAVTTSTGSDHAFHDVYFDCNLMGCEMRSREWFCTATHMPKSAIKTGIDGVL